MSGGIDWVFSFDTAAPGLALAFAAGLVNTLSPCCLAMAPAFLAHIAGVEAKLPSRRTRFAHTTAYIVGFSAVFVAIGLGLGLAGYVLADVRPALWRISGITVIVFGLLQADVLRLGLFQRSFELSILPPGRGLARSAAVGAVYSLAWTPCIGPVLGAILTAALVFGDVWQGGALLMAFAAGMAVPHFAAVVALDKVGRLQTVVHRHYTFVTRASGSVMVAMGILIFTGALTDIFRYFQAVNVVL